MKEALVQDKGLSEAHMLTRGWRSSSWREKSIMSMIWDSIEVVCQGPTEVRSEATLLADQATGILPQSITILTICMPMLTE